MQFTPKTKKELEEAALIPKGYYPVEIYEVEEKKSKSDNDMLVLKMKVYVGEGQRFLTDYIVLTNDLGLAKLFNLCEATGLMDQYHAGSVDADDIRGKECYIYAVQQTDKQTGELRNNLRTYLTEEAAREKHEKAEEKAATKGGGLAAGVARANQIVKKAAPASAPTAEDEGDDVPF